MRQRQHCGVLRATWLLAVFGVLTGGAASRAADDQAKSAERVMVVTPNAELKLEEEVVGLADVGHIYEVGRTNGAWHWIPARGGWIRARDVVSVEDAVVHFTRQIQQQRADAGPSPHPWHHRGRAHDALGHYEEAIDDLTESLRIQPNPAVRNDRGNVWFKTGDFERALADYTAAIEASKEYSVAYNNRSTVLARLGRFEEALSDLDAALKVDPKYAEAWNNRGTIRNDRGEHDKAVTDFSEAIRLAPDYAVAYHNRAHALQGRGDYADAVRDYETALKLDPQSVIVRNDLAWLLATCPEDEFRDGKRAAEEARVVLELAGDEDWNFLDTAAAAHAEAGDFEKAVRRIERALELAPEDEQADLKARAELYRAGKTYRLPPLEGR